MRAKLMIVSVIAFVLALATVVPAAAGPPAPPGLHKNPAASKVNPHKVCIRCHGDVAAPPCVTCHGTQ